MNRRTWWAIVRGIAESGMTEHKHESSLVLDLVTHSPKGPKWQLTRGLDNPSPECTQTKLPRLQSPERPTWEVLEWISTCIKPTGIRQHFICLVISHSPFLISILLSQKKTPLLFRHLPPGFIVFRAFGGSNCLATRSSSVCCTPEAPSQEGVTFYKKMQRHSP